MIALWWALGCSCGGPVAGELQTDVEALGVRTVLPPGATEARWTLQAARAGRGGVGRADARVFAWVRTEAPAEEWLRSVAGEPLGARAHNVPGNIARTLFSDEERAALRHDETKDTFRLACVRYPAAALGLGEYRGDVVLDCETHLYLALSAH